MRYYQCLILALIFGCVTFQDVSGVARVKRSADENLRDPGTYIVRFEDSTTDAQLHHFVKQLNRSDRKAKFAAKIIAEYPNIKCLTARLSERALKWVTDYKLISEVKKNKYFMFVSEVDSLASTNPGWHLDRVDQQALPLDQKYTASQYTGKSVDVYVLNTGIHYNHGVFNGRAHYPGCDPIDKIDSETRKGEDCNGHGTHVAGLVGGNGTGLATSVTLFSVRVANCRGRASEASLLDGLMCVHEHRKGRNGTRTIIHISLAETERMNCVEKFVKELIADGVVVTASAGNGNRDDFRRVNYDSCRVYPASYMGVINVAATDMNDNALMAEFKGRSLITNMGSCVDVFAPGYSILSSDICIFNSSCYNSTGDKCSSYTCQRFRTGTSQSSALVAGAVALLLEKCPNITNTEIRNTLRISLSKGRVRFCKAYRFLSVNTTLIAAIDVVGTTLNRLLFIGNLSTTNCEKFHGQPLITSINY